MSADAQALAAAFAGGPRVEKLADPPGTVEEAYDLQDAVRAHIGRPIVGWKLAQTTPGAQAAAGITAPTVSPLLEGMIVPQETVFGESRFNAPEVEAEIVLETAEDITGPLEGDRLLGAIAQIRLAIEVADTRYVDKPAVGVHSVIADMNSCGALVVGQPLDLGELSAAADGDVVMRLGDGGLVPALKKEMRPKPIEVLAFLSRFATARGHTIPAGTLITTGTHTAPTRSGPGMIAAEFAAAGKVTARLGAPRP